MNPGWRSLLFVPADDHARIAKVGGRGADAVILDLEDAVPLDRKIAACEGLPHVIDRLAAEGCTLVVRINAGWRVTVRELETVVRQGVAAVMVPKVEDPARLAVISEMIAEAAREAGLAEVPGIVALIENPAGMAELEGIAAAPGVIGLALGSEDFSLALGVPPTRESLQTPCHFIAWAAARHGLMALGLPVSIATIADTEAWANGVRAARAMGMTGALCIHPRQVAVANAGFSPSPEEVEAAHRILAAWRESAGAGVIQVDGRMIDRPVVLAAERTVSRAW